MFHASHFHPAARLLNSALLANLESAPQVLIDVTETDAAYTLRADVPGVAKDDISISIDGNVVRLDVEFKDAAAEGSVWRERRTGKASRAMKFSQPLDADSASAKHEHGVLTLTIAKRTDAQAKRVTIQ